MVRFCRLVAVGEFVQVGPFGGGEVQRPGQRVEDLPGRVHVAALLQERVVGGGDRRELGDLFPAQAAGPAAGTGGQADIGGLQPSAARAQQVRELTGTADHGVCGGCERGGLTVDGGHRGTPYTSNSRL